MKNLIHFILFFIIIVFGVSCAKVIAPTGGEKDETSPKILLCEPENMSTNFKEKKVLIRFDEFIELQNVTEELLITPLQEEKAEVKLRNKNLIILFKDTLIENTTYNLNFYDAIKDMNEGNVLKNYQYVFSTGKQIDTLFVIGHVYNAFNLEFADDVFVMLYKNLADSAPKTKKPYYITRTDEMGAFSINNIAPGSYKLFALKDANRNMIFDQAAEPIAFIDTLITPKVKLEEVFDTIRVFNDIDSTFYDSAYSKIVVVPATNELHLMLFTEDFENQYIKESKRDKKKELTISFNRRHKDTVAIYPLNFETNNDWYIYEANENHDKLTVWVKDSNIYKKDSIYLSLEYYFRDSLESWVLKKDTVNFLYVEKEIKEKSRREKRQEEQETDTTKIKIPSELKVKFSPTNFSEYDLGKKVFIDFNYPIQQIDENRITLYEIEDTIQKPQDFKLIRDSVDIRKYIIQTKLITEIDYKIIADSGAFFDIYNNVNDSTGVSFRIKKLEKYGTVFLTLQDYETPGILHVMNEKEEIMQKLYISIADSVLEIKYLLPQNYRLKYISDRNGNGKWDTGKYDEKLQPEPVFYYSKDLEVKENWDYEIIWNLLKD